jgi:hypothetical protein
VTATVVSLVFGVPLAWLLARVGFKGRSLVRALCTLSMVLPPVVGGVALFASFGRSGVFGQWLDDWFGVRLPFTTAGVVVAQTFVAMPFLVLTVEAALRQNDHRVEDAARTLVPHLHPEMLVTLESTTYPGTTTEILQPILEKSGLVVGSDIGRFAAAGLPTMSLVPPFDPTVENPIGWTPAPPDAVVTSEDRDGARVLFGGDDAIIGVETSSLSRPPAWLVTAAARGVPLAATDISSSSRLELSRASAAARRWAYRHHTVTRRAAEIARHAGLDIRDPQPHVAAILVSMRPDEAAAALDMLLRQTHRPLSVVVGLHGVQPTPDFTKSIDRVGAALPTEVLQLSERLSLGECLNRTIEASGAEILAKIDDDDFYGPAHIEDGVHALEYSGADIVGKGAQFTYVETEDRTVLRRQREQETFLGGSPTGATMLVRRRVWEQVGFPHRPRQVDVLFTRAARHNGSQVYAGSPWEFCYVRSARAHTWTAAAGTFLAGTAELWSGLLPERMVAPDLAKEIAAS